jgi:hypothetical protein
MLASRLRPSCDMGPAADPICPLCGSKVRDFVSDFVFSAEELPSLETAKGRVTSYKCACGHNFVVVSYDPQWPVDVRALEDSADEHQ